MNRSARKQRPSDRNPEPKFLNSKPVLYAIADDTGCLVSGRSAKTLNEQLAEARSANAEYRL